MWKRYHLSIEGARKLSALCSKIVYKRVRGKTSGRSHPAQNFLEYPPGLHKTLEHQQCKCQRNEKNQLASCPFGKRFPRFSEKSSSPLVARFDIIVSLIVFIKRERELARFSVVPFWLSQSLACLSPGYLSGVCQVLCSHGGTFDILKSWAGDKTFVVINFITSTTLKFFAKLPKRRDKWSFLLGVHCSFQIRVLQWPPLSNG